jgi:predicted site-specific integrase-resolvase
MKLSQYAKQQGISYSTALRWFHQEAIKGYQAPSGTVIVLPDEPSASAPLKVAVYARVSRLENKSNLESQAERLVAYCTAKGYPVAKVVKEIGSGVNDARPQFLALLEDQSIGTIVVEHKDRATRFGFRYLETLLTTQGRTLEVVNVEVVYEQAEIQADVDPALYAGIDIGSDNLATLTSNKVGFVPRLVNGRPLKSINQFYNKRKAELQSILKDTRFTARKERMTKKRTRRIDHYLHTASRRIIDLLVAERIGTLVIGKNPNWKQEVNIGQGSRGCVVHPVPFGINARGSACAIAS